MFRMHILNRVASFGVAYLLSVNAALALDIVSRSAWGANPPVFGMLEQTPKRITIHHTGTRQRAEKPITSKLKSLQNFSQSNAKLADGRNKKAWADVPYHFYIDAVGVIAEGRAVGFMGDTNTNYDPMGHISVVLEGNFDIETPSAKQLAALVDLLKFLSAKHAIEHGEIDMHRTFASTICPGQNLADQLSTIIQNVALE